jgi:hypothetical protein
MISRDVRPVPSLQFLFHFESEKGTFRQPYPDTHVEKATVMFEGGRFAEAQAPSRNPIWWWKYALPSAHVQPSTSFRHVCSLRGRHCPCVQLPKQIHTLPENPAPFVDRRQSDHPSQLHRRRDGKEGDPRASVKERQHPCLVRNAPEVHSKDRSSCLLVDQ